MEELDGDGHGCVARYEYSCHSTPNPSASRSFDFHCFDTERYWRCERGLLLQNAQSQRFQVCCRVEEQAKGRRRELPCCRSRTYQYHRTQIYVIPINANKSREGRIHQFGLSFHRKSLRYSNEWARSNTELSSGRRNSTEGSTSIHRGGTFLSSRTSLGKCFTGAHILLTLTPQLLSLISSSSTLYPSPFLHPYVFSSPKFSETSWSGNSCVHL